MVFSDLFFLFVFLPAFGLLYFLATGLDKLFSRGKEGAAVCHMRNATLIVFSLVFYAWGEPVYVFLMLLSVLLNFLAGRAIDASSKHRKAALVLGLAVNLGILGTFKYLSFFAGIFSSIGLSVPDPRIALPIGISFYTFQSISYLVDVYRKESPAQRNYFGLLLYISMFPQLIAGPIVRYDTVAREIGNRHVSGADFADGLFRFMLGLGKKVLIANQLAPIADQFLKDGLSELSTAGAWIGIVAFALQIYYDFSGYSDMAIGIGRCMGFHFKENFNHPYYCNSLTDMWRRWHMSLGSFFRDYVYIPMGGNRHHQSLNILVVWMLTGLWHGASWNFVFWGLYFGVFLMIEKYTLMHFIHRVPGVFLHVYALFLIMVGWGIFYFDDLPSMQTFFLALFGNCAEENLVTLGSALTDNFGLWAAALAFAMPLRTFASRLTTRICGEGSAVEGFVFSVVRTVFSLAVLLLSVAMLVGATNNPFLYTRF